MEIAAKPTMHMAAVTDCPLNLRGGQCCDNLNRDLVSSAKRNAYTCDCIVNALACKRGTLLSPQLT